MKHKNHPLSKLGDYTWADYYFFRDRLRFPVGYLAYAFRHADIPIHKLSPTAVINNYHFSLMEKRKVFTITERKYLTLGIPPQYLKDKTVIQVSNPAQQADFDWLVKSVELWVPKGQAFYFYSEFNMEGAVEAGAHLIKRAADKKIEAYFSSFPNIMEAIYRWDQDDPVLERIKKVNLLGLWAVGSEHTTEFARGRLKELIDLRCINGKSTVLCSGLTPTDYASRYGHSPIGIPMCFKGKTLAATISALKKELEKHG